MYIPGKQVHDCGKFIIYFSRIEDPLHVSVTFEYFAFRVDIDDSLLNAYCTRTKGCMY